MVLTVSVFVPASCNSNHISPDTEIVPDSCLSYHVTLPITLLKSFVVAIQIRHDAPSPKVHDKTNFHQRLWASLSITNVRRRSDAICLYLYPQIALVCVGLWGSRLDQENSSRIIYLAGKVMLTQVPVASMF